MFLNKTEYFSIYVEGERLNIERMFDSRFWIKLNILATMYMFYKLHKSPFTINIMNSGKEATDVYLSKIKPS